MCSDQQRCRYRDPAVSLITGCEYLASNNVYECMDVCKSPSGNKAVCVIQWNFILSGAGVPGKMIVYVMGGGGCR